MFINNVTGIVSMAINNFAGTVSNASAIRRIRRLVPVGGDGSYVAPPTYANDKGNAVHVFETRRIEGREVKCVLLDSVQSQANRLEESLEQSDECNIPNVVVDFTGTKIPDVGKITALSVPHRIFDAIIRDSTLGDDQFPDSKVGKAVNSATPKNATGLFQYSPSTLVFGGWNSTGDKGGSGRKFQRCIVSEIVGVNVPVHNTEHGMVGGSKRPSSRIDPLEIEKVEIYRSKTQQSKWSIDKQDKDFEKSKPSKVNHGNIPPSISDHGVTMEYALQTTTITLAGIRKLSFPEGGASNPKRDLAAQTVLATIALNAILEHDRAGYSLRSRCDLCPAQDAPSEEFEIIQNNGKIDKVAITLEDARDMLKEAVSVAKKENLLWETEPVKLVPREELVRLVEKSREKRLEGRDDAGS